MGIDKELIDKLLADYKGPEDLIGEQGLLKQLTKAFASPCTRQPRIMPRQIGEHYPTFQE
jgi:hypothetical protein